VFSYCDDACLVYFQASRERDWLYARKGFYVTGGERRFRYKVTSRHFIHDTSLHYTSHCCPWLCVHLDDALNDRFVVGRLGRREIAGGRCCSEREEESNTNKASDRGWHIFGSNQRAQGMVGTGSVPLERANGTWHLLVNWCVEFLPAAEKLVCSLRTYFSRQDTQRLSK